MKRVARFTAHNAKGFADFDVEFADVNVFSGWNGEGKTSFGDLFIALFATDKATNARHLLRTGTEEGFIQAIMVDDQAGETWTIRRDLHANGLTAPKIGSSRIGPISAYGKFLQNTVDLVSMEPLRRAMAAPPKEQAEILLRVLAPRISITELKEAAPGYVTSKIEAGCAGANGIDLIDEVYDTIFAERTNVNRIAEDKERTVRQLEDDLAKLSTAESAVDVAALRKDQTELSSRIATIEATGETELEQEKARLQREFAAQKECLERSAQERIDVIKRTLQTEIDAAAETRDKAVEKRAGEIQDRVKAETAALHEDLQVLSGNIARSEEQEKTANHIRSQRSFIDRTRDEGQAKQDEAERLTRMLKKLKKLRADLLKDLPIKELDFDKGRLFLGGIPLEEVNSAELARFWVRVAVMLAEQQDLGAVVLDNAEKWDGRNFPRIVQAGLRAAEASGVQFFLGRVEDHDFLVETGQQYLARIAEPAAATK